MVHILLYGYAFMYSPYIHFQVALHSHLSCSVLQEPAFPDAAGSTAMTVFTNKFPQLLLHDTELIPHGEQKLSREIVPTKPEGLNPKPSL